MRRSNHVERHDFNRLVDAMMTATETPTRRAARPKSVHVAIASRQEPDRVTAFEESLVRTIVENPGITQKHAVARVRGISPERATESMRVLATKALARPRVQKRLGEMRDAVKAKADKEIGTNRVGVLRDLLAIKERCMEIVPIFVGTGLRMRVAGHRMAGAADAIRALELIGRELGMFVERSEVRTGPLEQLADDELDQIIVDAALQAGIEIGLHRGRAASAPAGEHAQ